MRLEFPSYDQAFKEALKCANNLETISLGQFCDGKEGAKNATDACDTQNDKKKTVRESINAACNSGFQLTIILSRNTRGGRDKRRLSEEGGEKGGVGETEGAREGPELRTEERL